MNKSSDIFDNWSDLESLLINIEQSAEKANYLVCDLLEMESQSTSDYHKLFNWKNIEILSQLLLDYVVSITKDITPALENYNTLFDKSRNKKPAEVAQLPADYKWQLDCLNDRLEHPEKYEANEDVPAAIEALKQWIADYEEKHPEIKGIAQAKSA